MKENNKEYNAIDFARYHSGTMTPEEMHALEKAALEDPFLADALDGYKYAKDAEKELGQVRTCLDEKRKQQKVFSIFSHSSGTWWKIAAMFILFAGVGYFFYTANSKKEKPTAVRENVEKKENPPATLPIINDSSASKDNIAFEKEPVGKNENNIAKVPASTTKSKEVQPPGKTLPAEIGIEKGTSVGHLGEKKENTVVMNSDNAISSNVILKDSGEKSFFRSTDTTASVAASPRLYKPDSEPTVAMNQKNAALNEVVVTGYGARRKKDITGARSEKSEGKVSGVNITTSAPYPEDGKEKFDQYIKDNAVPVFDSSGKRITSNILLSFTINKSHKPAHIKVLESSCEACEKEAIRLLKNGPKWIGKRGDSGRVRIDF